MKTTLEEIRRNSPSCKRNKMQLPTPDEIKQARKEAGLTQTQAAELVHAKMRTWQDWEGGKAKINLAAWELFLIKKVKLDKNL